ncbi:MAG: response regulator transcription factor [Candidatus Obscuribacterales bacterium]|nr:response regulator transcription factor [Candidatus Obscuribacterales bacterium]
MDDTEATLERDLLQPKILIIDDDIKFCKLISDYLMKYGIETTLIHDPNEALQLPNFTAFHAIILDLMMPKINGYQVLKKIRETSDIPVLMLTALADEQDRINGLETGVDDYLPKTFSPRELLARIRAVLRRSIRPARSSSEMKIQVGDIHINRLNRSVTHRGDLLILTPVEFDLLSALALAKGRIKSREELLDEIKIRNFENNDRSIDVHISALRRKLQDDSKTAEYIRTVRCAGYMLIDPSKQR